jgi:hypothetical protein
MEWKELEPVRSRVVIGNEIIQQVNSFNYLGNLISDEKEADIDNKLINSLDITGVINNVFRQQNTLK